MEQEKYNPQEFYTGTEINREDIIAETAVVLEKLRNFPDPSRADIVEITKAKVETRKVLRNKGLNDWSIQCIEPEIREDAEKLLALFK